MQLISSIGTFSVSVVPGHPSALLVCADSEIELARLRRHALPDLIIEAVHGQPTTFEAVVARDEWAYAVEVLVDDIRGPADDAPAARAS